MQDKEILKQFNVQKFPSLMVMGGVTQVCGALDVCVFFFWLL